LGFNFFVENSALRDAEKAITIEKSWPKDMDSVWIGNVDPKVSEKRLTEIFKE
jgi:hypothetical protein